MQEHASTEPSHIVKKPLIVLRGVIPTLYYDQNLYLNEGEFIKCSHKTRMSFYLNSEIAEKLSCPREHKHSLVMPLIDSCSVHYSSVNGEHVTTLVYLGEVIQNSSLVIYLVKFLDLEEHRVKWYVFSEIETAIYNDLCRLKEHLRLNRTSFLF